jgi:hypothetical protein
LAELGKSFLSHFIGNRQRRRPATYLLIVKQELNESLIIWLDSTKKNSLLTTQMKGHTASPSERDMALQPFMEKVARKLPQHLEELMVKAEEFINTEETIKAFTKQAKYEKSPKRMKEKSLERRKDNGQFGRDVRTRRAENHFTT